MEITDEKLVFFSKNDKWINNLILLSGGANENETIINSLPYYLENFTYGFGIMSQDIGLESFLGYILFDIKTTNVDITMLRIKLLTYDTRYENILDVLFDQILKYVDKFKVALINIENISDIELVDFLIKKGFYISRTTIKQSYNSGKYFHLSLAKCQHIASEVQIKLMKDHKKFMKNYVKEELSVPTIIKSTGNPYIY